MIVVRNVFRLKFGKAKEAVALLKEGVAIQKRAGVDISQRILTDLTGPYYTLVLEFTLPDMGAWQASSSKVMGDKNWQATYAKFSELVDSGSRELFTVVE